MSCRSGRQKTVALRRFRVLGRGVLCRTGKQGSDRADAPLQLTDKAERKGERDGESGRLPERFSGQRRFRPHLSDGSRRVGVCLSWQREAVPLVQRQAHVPSSKILLYKVKYYSAAYRNFIC